MNSYEVGCLISDVFNLSREGKSLVAGGYLRDIDLGREPKDVDVLIEYEDDLDLKEAEIQARFHGYDISRVGGNYGEIGKDLHRVFKLRKEGELKIDLVFLNQPVLTRFYDFPCNMCMIYRHGETGEIVTSEDYDYGKLNKMVVYNPTTTRENYHKKMLEYFPDWDHVMPKGFQEEA